MAEVQRPGRVGGDELDVDPLGQRRAAAAEGVARARARRPSASAYQASARKRLRKPGPATSTLHELVAEPRGHGLPQPRGDVARLLAEHRRQQHRGVGRVVAEVGPWAGAPATGATAGGVPVAAQVGGGVLEGGAEGVERRHVNDGTARPRGSCARGTAARAAPRGRAGRAASAARSDSFSSPGDRGAERAADHEGEVAAGLAAALQPPRPGPPRFERRAALVAAATTYARSGIAAGEPLLLVDLDHLDARVARQQLLVVGDVVGERRAAACPTARTTILTGAPPPRCRCARASSGACPSSSCTQRGGSGSARFLTSMRRWKSICVCGSPREVASRSASARRSTARESWLATAPTHGHEQAERERHGRDARARRARPRAASAICAGEQQRRARSAPAGRAARGTSRWRTCASSWATTKSHLVAREVLAAGCRRRRPAWSGRGR